MTDALGGTLARVGDLRIAYAVLVGITVRGRGRLRDLVMILELIFCGLFYDARLHNVEWLADR